MSEYSPARAHRRAEYLKWYEKGARAEFNGYGMIAYSNPETWGVPNNERDRYAFRKGITDARNKYFDMKSAENVLDDITEDYHSEFGGIPEQEYYKNPSEYSPASRAFIRKEIHHLVHDKGYEPKRAVAAALNVAREKGYKVPSYHENPEYHHNMDILGFKTAATTFAIIGLGTMALGYFMSKQNG